jgi:hypothetical protein
MTIHLGAKCILYNLSFNKAKLQSVGIFFYPPTFISISLKNRGAAETSLMISHSSTPIAIKQATSK